MNELELQSLTVLEPEIGHGRFLDLETEHPPLHDKALIELEFIAVETDRDPGWESPNQISGAAGVIEVTVGVEHHRRLQSTGFHPLHDPSGFLAGIDDRQHTRIAITEQNAIGLDRTDRKNVEKQINHHKILNS